MPDARASATSAAIEHRVRRGVGGGHRSSLPLSGQGGGQVGRHQGGGEVGAHGVGRRAGEGGEDLAVARGLDDVLPCEQGVHVAGRHRVAGSRDVGDVDGRGADEHHAGAGWGVTTGLWASPVAPVPLGENAIDSRLPRVPRRTQT